MNPADFAVGSKVLITTDNWFYAPDGRTYRAAWGTVDSIKTDDKTLGIRTNARSTNWYVQLGSLLIAGCQIHYAVRCEHCQTGNTSDFREVDGEVKEFTRPSHIFNADEVH